MSKAICNEASTTFKTRTKNRGKMQRTNANDRCRLMDLPLELRRMIYEYVLRSSLRPRNIPDTPSSWARSDFLIGLFRTSKQMRVQAIPLFLQSQTFYIEKAGQLSSFRAWVAAGDTGLRLENWITSLTIHLSADDWWSANRKRLVLIEFLKTCSALRRLDIHLEGFWGYYPQGRISKEYISRYDLEELRTIRGLEWVELRILLHRLFAVSAELTKWLREEMYKPKIVSEEVRQE